MKIIVVSKYAAIPGYGPNPRWFELAKRFSFEGHQLEIITSDANHFSNFQIAEGNSAELKIENVTFHVLKTRKYKNTAGVARVLSWFDFDFRLFRFQRNINPDVIIISSLSLNSILFGIYIKISKGARLVFEVRDIWPLTMIEEGNYSSLNPFCLYLRGIELLGYRYADLIVGTMANLRQHVSESGINRPSNTFHSCGIGVPSKQTKPPKNYRFSSEIEKLIKGKIIIGYCGSIGLTNYLSDFAEYMENSSVKNTVFLIAGDGSQKQFFDKKLSKQDNVVFLGKISPEDVQGFLHRCDILFLATLPSRVWRYGQSMNKIVDYMLAGKFIIAQYEGYPSMIDEAKCGVFTNRDELANSFNDALQMTPEARSKKGNLGQSWILKHHNYDKLAKAYMKKIEQLYSA